MMPPRECMPRVLVVEDDPLWARLLLSAIERRCRVEWAPTLTAARRLLDDGVFDLVVTDLQVGKESGHRVPEFARRFSPRTPVLLLSGHPSIARVAADIRADAWIAKPVALNALRKAISALLSRRRRTRAVRTLPWNPSGPSSVHAMALFDSDAQRLDAVSTFAADGLRQGRRAVVILGRPLHAPLRALVLRKSGLDRLSPDFRLVASESLVDQVIRRGTASRKHFMAMAPGILGPVGGPSDRPFRLFGDAVDHLARRGDHRAAVQLEALWNEALPPQGAQVLCGYSRDGLEGASCDCLRDLLGRHDLCARAV